MRTINGSTYNDEAGSAQTVNLKVVEGEQRPYFAVDKTCDPREHRVNPADRDRRAVRAADWQFTKEQINHDVSRVAPALLGKPQRQPFDSDFKVLKGARNRPATANYISPRAVKSDGHAVSFDQSSVAQSPSISHFAQMRGNLLAEEIMHRFDVEALVANLNIIDSPVSARLDSTIVTATSSIPLGSLPIGFSFADGIAPHGTLDENQKAFYKGALAPFADAIENSQVLYKVIGVLKEEIIKKMLAGMPLQDARSSMIELCKVEGQSDRFVNASRFSNSKEEGRTCVMQTWDEVKLSNIGLMLTQDSEGNLVLQVTFVAQNSGENFIQGTINKIENADNGRMVYHLNNAEPFQERNSYFKKPQKTPPDISRKYELLPPTDLALIARAAQLVSSRVGWRDRDNVPNFTSDVRAQLARTLGVKLPELDKVITASTQFYGSLDRLERNEREEQARRNAGGGSL